MLVLSLDGTVTHVIIQMFENFQSHMERSHIQLQPAPKQFPLMTTKKFVN
jgi:hypothetical protein